MNAEKGNLSGAIDRPKVSRLTPGRRRGAIEKHEVARDWLRAKAIRTVEGDGADFSREYFSLADLALSARRRRSFGVSHSDSSVICTRLTAGLQCCAGIPACRGECGCCSQPGAGWSQPGDRGGASAGASKHVTRTFVTDTNTPWSGSQVKYRQIPAVPSFSPCAQ